jgi:FMN phosphatase YigB (HAD superfamily)
VTKPSFIYFDVGGVLVKDFTDTNAWEKLRDYLKIRPENHGDFDTFYSEVEEKMCLGVEADTFLSQFESRFKINIPKDFSFTNYCVNNFSKNPSIWPIVQWFEPLNRAEPSVRIGLLTDMYPRMRELIIEKGLFTSNNWDVVIDSSVEKLKKPMREIYLLAQERAGAPPQDILFIDNKEKNLVVPKDLGWQTFWYDSKDYEASTAKLKEHLAL